MQGYAPSTRRAAHFYVSRPRQPSRTVTVIAAFAIGGFPLLFGDLLLTGPTSGRTVAVPAQGDVQGFFGDSGWSISGLSQKVCLLSDSCAVAWAGSWLGARVAIAELRRRALSGPLSVEDATGYLTSEPDLRRNPAAFVGLTYSAGHLHQFHFGAEELQTRSLGPAYVSGSGAGAIHEFANLLQSMESTATGSPTVGNQAIANALSLGGMLLQSEFRGRDTAATLRSMFGGGYEIAYFSGGRMQKLPEITYVVWEAQIDESNVHVSHPQLLIKQMYSGDHLLIKSARVESSAAAPTPRIVDEQAHAIRPMFEAPPFAALPSLRSMSLQSRLLCHCILVRRSDMLVGLYTRVQQYSADSELTVTFEDSKGELRFGIRNDTALEIAKSLERFREPGPGAAGRTDL